MSGHDAFVPQYMVYRPSKNELVFPPTLSETESIVPSISHCLDSDWGTQPETIKVTLSPTLKNQQATKELKSCLSTLPLKYYYHSCIHADSFPFRIYLVTVSSELVGGTTEKLCAQVHQAKEPLSLKVSLEMEGGSSTILLEEDVTQDFYRCISFQVSCNCAAFSRLRRCGTL